MLHGGMHALKDAVQFRYLLKIVLMSLFLAKGPGHARLTTVLGALLVPPFKFGISDDPCIRQWA